MPSNPSQRAPDRQVPPGRRASNDTTERIRQMLKELDTPLDAVPGMSARSGTTANARKEQHKADKIRQRSDLKRARDAAFKAFGIKPTIKARRAATGFLAAGAVGLAAFTNIVPGSGGAVADYVNQSAAEAKVDATKFRVNAAGLKASGTFKRALIEEEGVRYVVYRDVAGYPTVGVGHLIDPGDNLRVGDRISKARVLQFLDTDLEEAEGHVRDLVGNLPLYQHEFDALVDLVYNVGPGNVSASESPRLNAAILAGDYDAIADELNYTHAAGKVARGLEFRSERRAQIFLDASYEDPRENGGFSTT